MRQHANIDLSDQLDPVAAAKEAGLRYVSDTQPGFRRVGVAKSFRYKDLRGEPIRDRAILERINSLAIPPAYRDVWICPFPNGHFQATGRDESGRKQYRYHPRWREVRDSSKFDRIIEFGRVLPLIHQRTSNDLALAGMPRDKLLAVVVRLLEETLIRVGNSEYAHANGSYGLTTLLNEHVEVHGGSVTFRFRGKSGKHHDIHLNDRRLARLVQKCQELPGQVLFEYVDDDGTVKPIDSGDVNDYLREITGSDYTAKDFRTWAATVLTAEALRECGSFTSETEGKRNLVKAIERVSACLGNTPAICRKCYIHPAVIQSYLEQTDWADLPRIGGADCAEDTPTLETFFKMLSK